MKPYTPTHLPPKALNHRILIGLVGRANASLARYDGLLQGMVNPAVLLSPLTTQEAVLSSRIEGTQATLDEVLELEAGEVYEAEKAQDINEIVNCRNALMQAWGYVRDRSISLAAIRQLHKTLMESVRGEDKKPGEFREEQVWIGPHDTPREKATFIPPNPLILNDYLEDLESYIKQDDFDPIVQTAIIHAQFELLHPFMDGNGRIGRLLIPLLLSYFGALSTPMFYMSGYLEENRRQYYSYLHGISQEKNWNGWIAFFLKGVDEQARENSRKVHAIKALYENMKREVIDLTHSQYSIAALDEIFNRPIFKTSDFTANTGIPKPTSMKILRILKDARILTTIREGAGQKAAILAYKELLDIAEGRTQQESA